MWESLYPGCDVRLEDERPFLVEWTTAPTNPARAIAALIARGFRVTLTNDDASDGGCRGAWVTSCELIAVRRAS